ncbi:hypothetical protein HCJ39_07060 [Listeria rocourtiae]|uniref:hypothetical protein n=1 Tax=Listeria rocourtiae TaxID=647910 RepID=UPI00162ACAE1|nr:hypothetical protein [Listeria rocourtiae]MBC1604469.1 hypothetical protein [Listeria rocourtiae]
MAEKKQNVTEQVKMAKQEIKTLMMRVKHHLKQKEVQRIIRYTSLFGIRKSLVWLANVGLFLLCYLATNQFLKLAPNMLVEQLDFAQKQAQQAVNIATNLQNVYLILVACGWVVYVAVYFVKWTDSAGARWPNARVYKLMLLGTMMPYFSVALLLAMGTPALTLYFYSYFVWFALAGVCFILEKVEGWYVGRIQRCIFQDRLEEQTIYTDDLQHLLTQEEVFFSVPQNWKPYVEVVSCALTTHKLGEPTVHQHGAASNRKEQRKPKTEWTSVLRVKGTRISYTTCWTIVYLPSVQSANPALPKLKIYANTMQMEGKEVCWQGDHIFSVKEEPWPTIFMQLKEWWEKRKQVAE